MRVLIRGPKFHAVRYLDRPSTGPKTREKHRRHLFFWLLPLIFIHSAEEEQGKKKRKRNKKEARHSSYFQCQPQILDCVSGRWWWNPKSSSDPYGVTWVLFDLFILLRLVTNRCAQKLCTTNFHLIFTVYSIATEDSNSYKSTISECIGLETKPCRIL